MKAACLESQITGFESVYRRGRPCCGKRLTDAQISLKESTEPGCYITMCGGFGASLQMCLGVIQYGLTLRQTDV